MKSQNDLNAKIVQTTMKIEENYPELTKYLDEMPVHFHCTSNKEAEIKDLKDYLDSLHRLLKTFSTNH